NVVESGGELTYIRIVVAGGRDYRHIMINSKLDRLLYRIRLACHSETHIDDVSTVLHRVAHGPRDEECVGIAGVVEHSQRHNHCIGSDRGNQRRAESAVSVSWIRRVQETG